MKKYLLLFGILTACTGLLSAQPCGTPTMAGDWLEQLKAHKRYVAAGHLPASRETQYLPIAFHLIANSNGEGRVNVRDVLSMLCYINEEFADMDVQFYIGELNYFDNTGAYDGTANAIYNGQRNDSAVNIYIANEANTNGGVGLTLAYYSPGQDWIVTRKDQVNGSNNTVVHELGHFFNLPHPHNGWDSDPWNLDDHGQQVGAFSPSGVPNEKQDGSNCDNAGDMICDTPPDYNFGFGWDDCNFTEEVLDPNGDEVDPEERLHMGYFLDCTDVSAYFFSPDQQDIMLADIASSSRNYLNNNFTPGPTEFDAPEPVEPANGELVEGYNSVRLEWSAVDGATFYLLRISPFISLNASTNLIVYGTSRVLTDLDPADTYYWTVKPLNAYGVCHNTASTRQSFITGTTVAATEVADLTDWSVQPNPVAPGQEVLVNITSARAFEAQLQLTDLNGRAVQRPQVLRLSAGQQTHRLATDGLSAGMYLLTLRDERGVSRQRVVVQ